MKLNYAPSFSLLGITLAFKEIQDRIAKRERKSNTFRKPKPPTGVKQFVVNKNTYIKRSNGI